MSVSKIYRESQGRVVYQRGQYPYDVLSASIKVAMQEQGLYRWCSILATRPDLQGNGFGTALMNIGYQKAN